MLNKPNGVRPQQVKRRKKETVSVGRHPKDEYLIGMPFARLRRNSIDLVEVVTEGCSSNAGSRNDGEVLSWLGQRAEDL